jgi:hypothetical protein
VIDEAAGTACSAAMTPADKRRLVALLATLKTTLTEQEDRP